MTPATVANWETGRSEPKARHLRALAEFLNVPMEAIDFECWKQKGRLIAQATPEKPDIECNR